MKLYSWEGRVWDVDIQRVRTGGLVFGGRGWLALHNFYNIKMGYIAVFDFMNRIDEARFFLFDQTQCPVQCLPYHPPSPPKPAASVERNDSEDTSMSSGFKIVRKEVDIETESGQPSVYKSPPTSFVEGGVDGTAYSLSEQLSFRHASADKKFCVVKRPRSGSIAGLNSLRISTVFVRRNIKFREQPSQCVLKIQFVGEIECRLTWGKRGYPDEVCINEFWSHLEKSFRFVKGMYLEFLIAEPSGDEGGLVLEVMVFNSDGTVCQPNVHRV
ncbi:hypothetical protein ACFE04_023085 [Oxalis oulophora]